MQLTIGGGEVLTLCAAVRSDCTEKEKILADLIVTGGVQRVGPVASRRLLAFFTATDPTRQMQDL